MRQWIDARWGGAASGADGILRLGGAALAVLAMAGCAASSSGTPAAGDDAVALDPTRFFAGAPPVAPHPYDSDHSECLDCHEEGGDVGEDNPAPATAHPGLEPCQQCHVQQLTDDLYVETGFVPRQRGARVEPTSAEQPPVIPHPTNEIYTVCLACHGAQVPRGPVTQHPERENCRQCHVESLH